MKDGKTHLFASPILPTRMTYWVQERVLSKERLVYLGGYLSKTACLAWAISICCLYEPRGMHSYEHISEIWKINNEMPHACHTCIFSFYDLGWLVLSHKKFIIRKKKKKEWNLPASNSLTPPPKTFQLKVKMCTNVPTNMFMKDLIITLLMKV